MSEHAKIVRPNTIGIGTSVCDMQIHHAHFLDAFFSILESCYSGYTAHDVGVAVGKVRVEMNWTSIRMAIS